MCIRDRFHAGGYTSGSQEELEPIDRGNELPDPDFKQTCSFKVWIYKGNPYDNYTLTLPATESKMDALTSAMGISNWSECKQLAIQCRVEVYKRQGGNLVHVQINIRNLVRLDMGQVPQIGKQVLQTFFICCLLYTSRPWRRRESNPGPWLSAAAATAIYWPDTAAAALY